MKLRHFFIAHFGPVSADKAMISRVILDTIKIMVVSFVGAQILTVLLMDPAIDGELSRELFLTGVITILIAAPVGFYLSWQRQSLNSLSIKLTEMASTDQLSGLLNRTSFIQAMRDRILHPSTPDGRGAFLYIDADHFKRINDEFGHAAGDEAIEFIGKSITENIRKTDIAGRLGGEEFGVYLEGGDTEVARALSEDIRQNVMQLHFDGEQHRVTLTVSIGVATHEAGEKPSKFMKMADENLYLAKSRGRNCVAA